MQYECVKIELKDDYERKLKHVSSLIQKKADPHFELLNEIGGNKVDQKNLEAQYRQLSSANSQARRRRNNPRTKVDETKGLDGKIGQYF